LLSKGLHDKVAGNTAVYRSSEQVWTTVTLLFTLNDTLFCEHGQTALLLAILLDGKKQLPVR